MRARSAPSSAPCVTAHPQNKHDDDNHQQQVVGQGKGATPEEQKQQEKDQYESHLGFPSARRHDIYEDSKLTAIVQRLVGVVAARSRGLSASLPLHSPARTPQPTRPPTGRVTLTRGGRIAPPRDGAREPETCWYVTAAPPFRRSRALEIPQAHRAKSCKRAAAAVEPLRSWLRWRRRCGYLHRTRSASPDRYRLSRMSGLYRARHPVQQAALREARRLRDANAAMIQMRELCNELPERCTGTPLLHLVTARKRTRFHVV